MKNSKVCCKGCTAAKIFTIAAVVVFAAGLILGVVFGTPTTYVSGGEAFKTFEIEAALLFWIPALILGLFLLGIALIFSHSRKSKTKQ
ncbi:MAG: hypothetical protein PHX37_01965 [Eubacteriales bacterium]|nr:hypothetical protein [Eubacteriales bacterium]